MEALDLERRRDLAEVLGLAWRLLRAYLAVFLALALVAVTPVVLLVNGVWGGALADVQARPSQGAQLASGLLNLFLVTPLVTATHVVAVQDLARGAAPAVGRSLRVLLGAAPPLLVAAVLYALGTILGSFLLLLPAVWFAIRCFFAPHAVLVEGRGGTDALRRSAALVRGCWWRTFGSLLAGGVLAALLAVAVALVLGIPAALTESGALLVAATILASALGYAYTALVGVLLFFDLRVRRGEVPGEQRESAGAPDAPISR